MNDGTRGFEKTLNSISKTLKLPEEDIYRASGLLKPQKGRDVRAERLMYQIEHLNEDDQETIAALIGYN